MYSIIGWVNFGILGILVLPYLLRLINDKLLKKRSMTLKSIIKFLRKVHKPLGILLLIGAFVHGYMALGEFKLHTGTVLSIIIAITAILGLLFNFLKKKQIFSLHRLFALIIIILLLIHLLFPSALYYIFGI